MNRIATVTLAITFMLGSFVAQACTFDSDCGVGSSCVKNDGVFGACM